MDLLHVTVLGIGNSLMGDDAVGLHVVSKLAERLEGERFPGLRLEIADAPGGLDAVTHVLDRDRVIIVDAVIAGGSVGQIIQFDADRIPSRQHMAFSLHGLNLADALNMIHQLYPHRTPPVVRVVGVEIGEEPEGMSRVPSRPVHRAVPAACGIVEDILYGWARERTPEGA